MRAPTLHIGRRVNVYMLVAAFEFALLVFFGFYARTRQRAMHADLLMMAAESATAESNLATCVANAAVSARKRALSRLPHCVAAACGLCECVCCCDCV